MNKNIIISTALIAGLSLAAASTFAATGTSTTTASDGSVSTVTKMTRGGGFGGMGGHGMGPMMEMTDAEKTAFEAMSDTEKQTYIETKRAEMEAKRDARESVIDKLLSGTPLTAEEEKIRQEIITERAAMKVKRAEMEAKREQIQAILAKKEAGTTLTSDEQTLLDSMPV